jgi:hypothetical protein
MQFPHWQSDRLLLIGNTGMKNRVNHVLAARFWN